MTVAQAGFALRGRNPDVLTCIANLSNDEVFTPPDFANGMLDTLGDVWAADHLGESLWADPTATFLDPCTKSGVFLREITSRLVTGLADQIPDLQTRVEHILSKQVFGIATTHLTSLLSRRSLYCSKHALGTHSIGTGFKSDAGNIWFERTKHSWSGDRCRYCGANRRDYDRGAALETHAYSFIHTEDHASHVAALFGGSMQFDIVVGNPPYQLGQSGGDAIGSFAMPIYQKFIQAAKSLAPRYLTMVTPSRWFAGGRGLDEFRQEMLGDRRLRVLVDFPESRDVFAGVDIAGGISYFLWDSEWNGPCDVTTIAGGRPGPKMARYLDEYDLLVRQNEAIPILHRVLASPEGNPFTSLAHRVAPIQPFSIRTTYRGAPVSDGMTEPVVIYQSGGTAYIERSAIPRNVDWVDQWKVIVGGAVPAGGRPDRDGRYYGLIGIRVLPPGTACTETYLLAGRFGTEPEAVNYAAYLRTNFVRFLVSLRTNTQHLYSERFSFVPDLPMDRTWTDPDLFAKYSLTPEEIALIEDTIRPMAEADE